MEKPISESESVDETVKRIRHSSTVNHAIEWIPLSGKVALAILIVVSLGSCSFETDSRYPYLRFDKNDTKTFIDYQKGRILVFNSLTAPSRSYQVEEIIQRKSEYTRGMGFLSEYASKYYDYDERIITFKNLNGKINKWVINYRKSPSASDASGKPDLSSPAKLHSRMLMWEWNGTTGHQYPIDLNDKTELVTLQIGNQQVRNVRKITSVNNRLPTATTKSSNPERLDWDINVLYFSAELGVIGFSNEGGDTWLLEK